MFVINFLIIIFLPTLPIFSRISPEGTIPLYFTSNEAVFLAGEYAGVAMYWAGYLRHNVELGRWSEGRYFSCFSLLFVITVVSKIIFAFPVFWFIGILAYILGVVSGSSSGYRPPALMSLIILMSILIFGYSTFILVGFAWFNFTPADYYYYPILLSDTLTTLGQKIGFFPK